ncbi:hypothetical protein TMatcc_010178 [Talaromyces marneffei ATCC 18224]|nr:hypothetical protein EYB25_009335 [Talaromyces marneffei]
MASDYPEDSFGIDLVPAEGERGFHTKINPQQPFQRSTIHEDRRALAIKCSLVDVIHGRWCADGDDNDYYATLLVLDFLFDVGNKLGRRIKSAKITVTFYGESDDDDHPGVVNISLNGSYSLLPTTQSETITNGLTASASANVLSADATYISGVTCLIGVDWDPANAVEWKLQENATLKTGLPATLRAGILLKRESMENFKCAVDIESEVDLITNVGRWFGGKPKDDPVLFKPSLKPTNRLMQYDANNLGKFDTCMSLVEDVTFTTVLGNAVTHRD